MNNTIDIGLVQLGIAFVLLLYSIILLIWWWGKRGRASQMYVYVLVLIGGCLINAGMAIYVRILGTFDRVAHYNFLNCVIWEWRYTPFNIAMVIMAVSISRKIAKTLKKEKEVVENESNA